MYDAQACLRGRDRLRPRHHHRRPGRASPALRLPPLGVPPLPAVPPVLVLPALPEVSASALARGIAAVTVVTAASEWRESDEEADACQAKKPNI